MVANQVKSVAMRFVAIVVVMAVGFLHLSTDLKAGLADERASLRGLPGAGLVIEELHSAAKVDGLSEDSIRTAVELILRSSGIRILDGPKDSPDSPWLYVRVSSIKSRSGFHAFAIQVELKQLVSLMDRPESSAFAATWEQATVGHVADIRNVISVIEQMVKAFANDFLAVNPK